MATVRGSGLGRMVVRSAHRIWARQKPIPVSARGPALQAANSNGIPDWLSAKCIPQYGPRESGGADGGSARHHLLTDDLRSLHRQLD